MFFHYKRCKVGSFVGRIRHRQSAATSSGCHRRCACRAVCYAKPPYRPNRL